MFLEWCGGIGERWAGWRKVGAAAGLNGWNGVFGCIAYMALIFWDQKSESGPVDIVRVDTLLVSIERVDLYVSMVVVVVTVDSPGNKVLDIWSGEGTEGDDISSSYRSRPSCRCSSDSELRAMVLSLGFDLVNNTIIDAPTYACPLCSETFLIKGASEMLIVDEGVQFLEDGNDVPVVEIGHVPSDSGGLA
jgi:hypothetical protein